VIPIHNKMEADILSSRFHCKYFYISFRPRSYLHLLEKAIQFSVQNEDRITVNLKS